MDDLTYTLRQLCRRNRDGSHNTQADRIRSLGLIARQLCESGFRQMKAPSLKGKHVLALLDRWQGEGLSPGTIKNRLAHLRWWAEKSARLAFSPRTTRNWEWPTGASSLTSAKPRNWEQALARSPTPMCT